MTDADKFSLLENQAAKADFMLRGDPLVYNEEFAPIIFVGDGVDDLDSMMEYMTTNTQYRYQMDCGFDTDLWVSVSVSDMQHVRDSFVALYGEVRKPDVYGRWPIL